MDKEVKVQRLPKCDFCEDRAYYDSKTKAGPWANMCEFHWRTYAQSKRLGLGVGQKLVLERDN